MASNALAKWQADRRVRLDRLEVTHSPVAARTLADGLNRALILQLAAEFQGFARELHDEAARALAAVLAPGDPVRQRTLIVPYQKQRRLARGNASPASLGEDFGLFGLRLWEGLRRLYPIRGQQWHDRLALLNEARNGLAHADDQKVAKVTSAGWPLTLRSARRWRGMLDGLVVGMDRVVYEHLRRKLGVTAWRGEER
jgi:hypothetical protein